MSKKQATKAGKSSKAGKAKSEAAAETTAKAGTAGTDADVAAESGSASAGDSARASSVADDAGAAAVAESAAETGSTDDKAAGDDKAAADADGEEDATAAAEAAPTVAPKRMSPWDFATWRVASDDPVMRSTIIGLLLLESAPDWEALRSRFDRASRNLVVLRQKVVEGPSGLETPRMVLDPDFDLDFHLRRFRMPSRSRWADVLEECRRQSMTDFDRDRPLWRLTLLEGLPDGKAALIVKLHHAIADGQGAVMLGLALFDFTETPEDLGPMPPAPVAEESDSSSLDVMVRDNLGWAAKSATDFVRGLGPATLAGMKDPGAMAQRVVKTAGSILRFTKIPLGPLSPLMTERSISYHFDTFDMEFANIRRTAKANEATANDVFLTGIAEGLGEYHRRMGKPVEKLRVNMPISLRQQGSDTPDNAVTIARFELPVASRSPVDIMNEVGETVRKWRAEPALAMADQIAELSRLIPPELIAAVAQASDLTASNVPGVPVPVWVAGARVLRMYPLVATIGAAVNVTMLTYNGTASIGISTDDAAVDDREELIRCLRTGFRTVTGSPVAAGTPLTRRRHATSTD